MIQERSNRHEKSVALATFMRVFRSIQNGELDIGPGEGDD